MFLIYSSLPEEKGEFFELEENVFLRLVNDMTAEIPSDYTIPSETVKFIELKFDVMCYLLLSFELLHSRLCNINYLLYEIIIHIGGLNNGFDLLHFNYLIIKSFLLLLAMRLNSSLWPPESFCWWLIIQSYTNVQAIQILMI